MDFTGQYAFASTQPYPSFAPIPPLTPGQSGPSEDYNRGPANAAVALHLPGGCSAASSQNPHELGLICWRAALPEHYHSHAPASPLPACLAQRRAAVPDSRKCRLHSFPSKQLLTPVRPKQDPFESIPAAEPFHAFDIPNGFGGNAHHGFAGPPTPPNQHGVNPGYPQHQHQPLAHQRQPALSRSDSSNGTMPGPKSDIGADDSGGARGGSEDDDNLTPAQSRRKAQNRAAYVLKTPPPSPASSSGHAAPLRGAAVLVAEGRQRAFRERKEKHVKDLEAKLANLEAAQQEASVENERLKRDLQKMSTENEILRATSSMGHGHQSSHSPEPITTAPMRYSPTDFYSNVLQNHPNKQPSHRITTSDQGERLLAAGATWDYIIAHDLFKRGLVDVGGVSELLKDCARCDGQGPVFAESDILRAIEQSVASGSDDLL
ncbi:hypothetical protein Purlil1_11648 [Purpureocillium lilacinum]|uniref:BZIP transcription factor (Fcr3) n=1 Tax=Purpureocillium lilacinum TaxID=33203 RepID=A0ABR0BJ41_PURLI|nr:hypothetical protein Purlil1_11648 [Purpureocillium lilacinum]